MFSHEDKSARYDVYIFLHDECVISRYYTIPLSELHEEYGEIANFIGVFPNPQVDGARLLEFREKFNLSFDLTNDPDFGLVNRFDARITPEVFVVDRNSGKVLYAGRIDNAYARVGKKRSHVTKQELRAVLEVLRAEKIPKIENQPAIGCFITKSKSE